jgi:hypothetical protein
MLMKTENLRRDAAFNWGWKFDYVLLSDLGNEIMRVTSPGRVSTAASQRPEQAVLGCTWTVAEGMVDTAEGGFRGRNGELTFLSMALGYPNPAVGVKKVGQATASPLDVQHLPTRMGGPGVMEISVAVPCEPMWCLSNEPWAKKWPLGVLYNSENVFRDRQYYARSLDRALDARDITVPLTPEPKRTFPVLDEVFSDKDEPSTTTDGVTGYVLARGSCSNCGANRDLLVRQDSHNDLTHCPSCDDYLDIDRGAYTTCDECGLSYCTCGTHRTELVLPLLNSSTIIHPKNVAGGFAQFTHKGTVGHFPVGSSADIYSVDNLHEPLREVKVSYKCRSKRECGPIHKTVNPSDIVSYVPCQCGTMARIKELSDAEFIKAKSPFVFRFKVAE